MLDPGQRGRASRKGRVKEAESTAAIFLAVPAPNLSAVLNQDLELKSDFAD